MRLDNKNIWCVFYSSDMEYLYDNESEAHEKLKEKLKEWPYLNWKCLTLQDVGFEIWSIGNEGD
jgi:hypothetical protein